MSQYLFTYILNVTLVLFTNLLAPYSVSITCAFDDPDMIFSAGIISERLSSTESWRSLLEAPPYTQLTSMETPRLNPTESLNENEVSWIETFKKQTGSSDMQILIFPSSRRDGMADVLLLKTNLNGTLPRPNWSLSRSGAAKLNLSHPQGLATESPRASRVVSTINLGTELQCPARSMNYVFLIMLLVSLLFRPFPPYHNVDHFPVARLNSSLPYKHDLHIPSVPTFCLWSLSLVHGRCIPVTPFDWSFCYCFHSKACQQGALARPLTKMGTPTTIWILSQKWRDPPPSLTRYLNFFVGTHPCVWPSCLVWKPLAHQRTSKCSSILIFIPVIISTISFSVSRWKHLSLVIYITR